MHLAPAVVGISVVEFEPVVVPDKQPRLVVEPTVLVKQLDVRLLHRQLVEKLEPELPIVLGRQLLVQPGKPLVVRLLVRLRPELVWPLVVRLLVPLVAPAVELGIVAVPNIEHRPAVVEPAVVGLDIAGKPAVEQAVAGIDNTPAVVLAVGNIVVVRCKLSSPRWLLFTIFTKFWLTTVVFMLQ